MLEVYNKITKDLQIIKNDVFKTDFWKDLNLVKKRKDLESKKYEEIFLTSLFF